MLRSISHSQQIWAHFGYICVSKKKKKFKLGYYSRKVAMCVMKNIIVNWFNEWKMAK